MPNGKQRRESVGALEGLDPCSITDAQAAHAKREVQKRERRIFDMLPEADMTFNELTDWYLKLEKVKSLAYYKTLCCNLDKFNQEFGNTLVSQIKVTDLENYQIKRVKEDYSNSYIDQQIEAAGRVVNKAFDDDRIGGDCLKPFRKLKNLLKKGANARDRVLTHEEYNNLLDALPNHAKWVVATAYWTGMRRGEVLNLTWDKVRLQSRIIKLEATDTKEGKPKLVPISKTLHAMLVKLPNRLRDSESNSHVFQYAGKPIKDVSQSVKTACKSVDIKYGRFEEDGFILHDLRHSFATNARRAGVSRNVRMAIMGHSSGNDMNFRYDTIDESDLLDAVDKIEDYLQNVDHSVDQGGVSEDRSVKSN